METKTVKIYLDQENLDKLTSQVNMVKAINNIDYSTREVNDNTLVEIILPQKVFSITEDRLERIIRTCVLDHSFKKARGDEQINYRIQDAKAKLRDSNL